MAKITIIDDSKATVDMLSTILSSGSHQVSSFLDSSNVEMHIATDPPDLILLDVVMPQRNGYEVLRALKRDPGTKNIPVILVTSKSEETDIKWGKRQGASEYVTKPFTPQSILSAVNAQL